MQLHTLVDHLALQIGREELGLRRGGNIELPLQVQLDAAVDEHAHRGHLGVHLGQLELRVLEGRHRLAEGLALFHVVHREAQRRLRGRDGIYRHRQALLWKFLHQVDEPHALFAKQVFGRHAHVVEEELGGVLRLHAHLLQLAALAEARHAGLDQQEARALGAGSRIGLGDHDHQIRQVSVGDEDLRAIDDVVIAVAHGRGFDALQVGARAGLGHGNGADQFAGGHARQVFFLQQLAAVIDDVRRDDVVVQPPADAREPRARDFLVDHAVVEEVRARAAVLLGDSGAEETLRAGLVPDLAVDVAFFFPALVVRRAFLLEELADAGAEDLVLFAVEGAWNHRLAPVRYGLPAVLRATFSQYVSLRSARATKEAGGRKCSP